MFRTSQTPQRRVSFAEMLLQHSEKLHTFELRPMEPTPMSSRTTWCSPSNAPIIQSSNIACPGTDRNSTVQEENFNTPPNSRKDSIRSWSQGFNSFYLWCQCRASFHRLRGTQQRICQVHLQKDFRATNQKTPSSQEDPENSTSELNRGASKFCSSLRSFEPKN